MAGKTNAGNFFEDFRLGQKITHATPRTVTTGDVALYTALYNTRFAIHSSDVFARAMGMPMAPLDDLLVFHVVFGKTVADISLNAVANLGYAHGVFGASVYAGDTLSTTSEIIGLKENSNGKTGIVYVHSVGRNQAGEMVLDYVRWVMVNKGDRSAPTPEPVIPELPDRVATADLVIPTGLELAAYDTALSGSAALWEDYAIGERIDHIDGVTIEEAEHMMAARLYQNTARVHFNQFANARRIIYGGHITSLARALSFNGLANAFRIAAINGGTHVGPTFAGDTIYAWSEILDRMEVPGRRDIGALRLRTCACKNQPSTDFPDRDDDAKPAASLVLDFDYTVLIPRRA